MTTIGLNATVISQLARHTRQMSAAGEGKRSSDHALPDLGKGLTASQATRWIAMQVLSPTSDPTAVDAASGNTKPRFSWRPTPGRIESLEKRLAVLEAQTARKASAATTCRGDVGGRGSRRRKEATKNLASKRLKQLQKDITLEVEASGQHVSEAEVRRELQERVYSRSFEKLAEDLHERYGYPLAGAKTLSRTPEYRSWAQHRTRKNARRISGDSPALLHAAKGGVSPRSGRSRQEQFADANNLRVARFGKIPDFDDQAREQIAKCPDARKWLEENGSALGGPGSTDWSEDNP